MSTNYEFEHAAGAILDYGFDWKSKGWLDVGETIVVSTWIANSADITFGVDYNVNGVTTIVVSGALLGKIYRITNSIETNQSRKDKRTLVISCKAR